jgi:hypothetical protein
MVRRIFPPLVDMMAISSPGVVFRLADPSSFR